MPIAQGGIPVNTNQKNIVFRVASAITDNTLKDGYWYLKETEFPEIFVNKNQKEIFIDILEQHS